MQRTIEGKRINQRARQRAETHEALLRAARQTFAEKGYHNVGVREFATLAGVTRGAIYDHFGDKETLFLAVVERINQEKRAAAAARRKKRDNADRWMQLRDDLQFLLDETAHDQEFQQIRIIDAPSVLGWSRWRALDSHHGLKVITVAVEQSVEAGLIAPQPVRALAQMIWVAVNEAAMMIAHSDDPDKTRLEVGDAIDSLLSGLELRQRKPGPRDEATDKS